MRQITLTVFLAVLAATPLAAENDGDDHFHCGFISEALSFEASRDQNICLSTGE
jgi:hypothetical protein